MGVVAKQTQVFSTEEIARLSDFEGNQIDFRNNGIWGSYVYASQALINASTDVYNPKVSVNSFLKLTAVDDSYCFSALYFGFNVFRQVKGSSYDSISVAIGFPSNIKKGDAQLFGFKIKSDADGNTSIGEDQIEEILSNSIKMKRPLNFYFFDQGKPIASSVIAYSKVGQKLGGIIKTRDNLAKKYVLCEE